jgi:hypothetical protein
MIIRMSNEMKGYMYKKMDELKEMKEDTYERINSKKIQTNS